MVRRKQNKSGGGAQTNANGLKFERDTDILVELQKLPYLTSEGEDIFYEGKLVASVYEKHGLYKKFLEPQGIIGREILSKLLLPDTAVINHKTKQVFIVEKKFQERSGSVDEKLQTGDFKLRQYRRLLEKTEYEGHFLFLLNGWFERNEYDDVKKYIKDVDCDYFLETLPFEKIGMDEDSLK